MPTIDELQDEFGLDDEIAVKFLISRGYCLQNDMHWLKPEAYHVPTRKEWFAVDYLHEAFGYGKHLSVNINKPIKKFCELKDSELLRAYMRIQDVSWKRTKRRNNAVRVRRRKAKA